MKSKYNLFIFFLFFFFLIAPFSVFAITVEITATVPGCGDGSISVGEQCDGSNLGGASCVSRGFAGGTLSCSSSCSYTTSSCTTVSSGGGGGGGGAVFSLPIPLNNVVFVGRAYPESVVTLLKDAQVVAKTVAGPDANFQITISGLSGGNFIFSVYSEDKNGIQSALLNFPVSVTSGVTTKVSGIFIAPTISADKSEVKKGDNVVIFGQSTPSSEITVSINSEEEFFVKKKTDESGAYLIKFDTSVLEMGDHHAKSKVALAEEITSYGKAVAFKVGTKNVVAEKIIPKKRSDANGDGKVNLVDFSIAAYWYKRPNPPLSADLNSDGKVNLVDFSIMAFNWTG